MSLVRIDARIRCPFCHDSILTGPRTGCAECLAWHHTACLEEHGSCSSCGASTPRQTTRQDLSEVLAQVCQTQGCFSFETLDRAGRRICAQHARAELIGVTLCGLLSLVGSVALGLTMIGSYLSHQPGPWPALAFLVVFMFGVGVFAVYRHSGESAAIKALRHTKARETSPSAPPVELRASAKKVSS